MYTEQVPFLNSSALTVDHSSQSFMIYNSVHRISFWLLKHFYIKDFDVYARYSQNSYTLTQTHNKKYTLDEYYRHNNN